MPTILAEDEEPLQATIWATISTTSPSWGEICSNSLRINMTFEWIVNTWITFFLVETIHMKITRVFHISRFYWSFRKTDSQTEGMNPWQWEGVFWFAIIMRWFKIIMEWGGLMKRRRIPPVITEGECHISGAQICSTVTPRDPLPKVGGPSFLRGGPCRPCVCVRSAICSRTQQVSATAGQAEGPPAMCSKPTDGESTHCSRCRGAQGTGLLVRVTSLPGPACDLPRVSTERPTFPSSPQTWGSQGSSPWPCLPSRVPFKAVLLRRYCAHLTSADLVKTQLHI